MQCKCGGVKFETVDNRLALTVEGGTVTATASKQPNGTIKLEHLECQSCINVYVGEADG